MTTRTRARPIRLLWTILLGTAMALTATPALAATPSPGAQGVQAQIDQYLAKAPGGKQINANEISYDGGVFVVTFAAFGTSPTGADCPSGWFCFYDRTNYGYPRGKLSSCGWQDLAWWGWNDMTESVHYNMSSGSVSFINHGRYADHSDDTVLFTVSTTSRYLSDVSPYRNVADHVYRSC
ncbi:peptidase inhibitor family I36 protein [Hamadaea tsunoensis]|uniref:peptidase inhibitor family I36 protein n=1 Tax=Hamadaea tsunoensis TaxID=53368 RepID=UPI000482666D|nr:peptidase inhibitor family I36 protein [Hamadaea tsunoensis]